MSNPIVDILPVTTTQLGLLYIERTHTQALLYHEQYSAILTGKLDIERLKAAWQKTVAAHTILRTIFDWDGQNDPVQIVLNQHTPEMYAPAELLKESEVSALLEHDRQKDFQLDTVPPHRILLLKTGENTHLFIFTYHHILLDGSSVPKLLDHLAKQYNQPSTTTELNNYGDYIQWAQSLDQQQAKDAWSAYAAKFTHHPQPQETGLGETKDDSVTLSKDATEQLFKTAQEKHLTLNSIFQTQWALTLALHKGQSTVCVGSPVLVKPLDGALDEIVGLCVATIPYFISFDTKKPVLDTILTHQRTWGTLIEYGHLGLQSIKKAISYQHYGDPFDTIITYTDMRTGHMPHLEDIDWKVISHNETTQYALSIDTLVSNKSVELKATYINSSYPPDEVRQLLQSFAKQLEAFTEHPQIVPAVDVAVSEEISTLKPLQDEDESITKTIIDVWSSIFQTSIHADSHFFELGGDSIISLRIVSKLRDQGVTISMRDIFDEPTPRLLSRVANTVDLKSSHAIDSTPHEVRVLANQLYGDELGTIVRASQVQQGILHRSPREQTLYHDQSTFTYQGTLHPANFEKAWNAVISNNDALRMRYFQHENVWYAALKDQPITINFQDVRDNSEPELTIKQSIATDAKQSYNVQRDPLLRLKLYQTADETFVLFLSFHILATDGWSFAFLLDDVFTAYESLQSNKEVQLPKRLPTYVDYLQSFTQADLIAARQHWRTYLAHVTTTKDHNVIEDFTELDTVLATINETESNSLQSFASSKQLSLNSLVQASWAIANAQPGEQIVFGATSSQRLHNNVSYDGTIGLFFNDIPIIAHIDTTDVSGLANVLQRDFQANLPYGFISAYELAPLMKRGTDEGPYTSLVVFENYPKMEEESLKNTQRGGLMNTRYWRRDMADIPKTLYAELKDGVIALKLSYNTKALSKEEATTLITAFVKVLKTCIS